MPSPVTPANPPTYLIVNSSGVSSLNVAPQQAAGPLMQVVVTSSGAGYTPGATDGVALTTLTGTGSGAIASIFVTGNVVTAVNITNNGTGYNPGDTMSIPGGGTLANVQVTYIPSVGSSTLELSGVNALNWGSNIWESLYRITESFASSSAPGVNTVLGGTNVTPLAGQLWFDTTASPGALKVWGLDSAWHTIGTSSVATVSAAVQVPTNPVTVSPTTGAVQVGFSPSGVTAGSYTLADITVDTYGRITAAANGSGGGGGSVTSVAATGSTGLVVGGSPITTSGTLTFTLSAQLQSLSVLPSVLGGVVQCTGANTYTTANLTSGQITTGLGFTPYNATNPAGYITATTTPAFTGDVTKPVNSTVTTIAPNVVTNAKLAQAPALRIKGNNTGVTANVADLTGAQVLALLPLFTGLAAGIVPPSPGGTTTFLRADATWAPAGGAPTMLATPIVLFDSGVFSTGKTTGGLYFTSGPLNNSWTNYNLASTLGVVAKAVILEGYWIASAPGDGSISQNIQAGYLLERADMAKGRTVVNSGQTGPWVDTFAVAKSISSDFQYWNQYSGMNQGIYPVRQVAQVESVTVSGKGGPVTTNYTLPAGSIDYLVPRPYAGSGGLAGAAIRIVGYFA